ncbi:Frigida-like protein [Dioscorea alata]|uniref:Frigida-like protein n=1 Tax=Dioscorea alata TaxID=55571 RepID=A0ACB7WFL3_DIOAL|nr:Frigida-like protein [Dioscorea alata]
MSGELVSGESLQKSFNELESQQALISNCTALWKSLSIHFSALKKSLSDRSHAIDSKLKTLDASTQESLASLDLRESSLSDREAAAAARIRELQLSALADIENPNSKQPDDVPGILRWYSRRMDSSGIWRFMVSRRKDLALLRKEISDAVSESVDPARLVLDAVNDFMEKKMSGKGGPDRCWALGMLIRVLYDFDAGNALKVSGSIRERAAKVVERWKEEAKGEGGVIGGPEAQILLQLVVVFGLQSKFEQEFLKKLVLHHASRKEMAKLATYLGFGEKLADIIDELGKTGKELEAIYFAYESGFTEKFSPVPLLKSYVQSSRKNAASILKNGNCSPAAMEESITMELNALKSVIKCVETYKLESKFTINGLKKRVAQLEKTKADKKKTSTPNKSRMKRTRPGGPPAPFRPTKASRTLNTSYPSLNQHPPIPPQVGGSRHSFKYSEQGSFDGPSSGSHRWSPNPASQPYHVPEDIIGARGNIAYGGSSSSYGGFDYAPSHTTTTPQPHQYTR